MAIDSSIPEFIYEGGKLSFVTDGRIEMDFDRLRVVLHVDPELGPEVGVNFESTRAAVEEWLMRRGGCIQLVGIERVELVELPETFKSKS